MNIEAVRWCHTASQFDQAVGGHGSHQTPSRHCGLPTALCPAAGAASTRRDMKHRFPPATQCLRILQPPFAEQSAAPDKPQHDGSPSLVVSHDDSCSPSRRTGSAGADHPASVGGGAACRAVRLPVVTRRRATTERSVSHDSSAAHSMTTGPASPRTSSEYTRRGWATRLLVSPRRAPPGLKAPPLDFASGGGKLWAFSRRRSADPTLVFSSPSRSAHHWHSASGVLPPRRGIFPLSSIIQARVFLLAISPAEPGPKCKWPSP